MNQVAIKQGVITKIVIWYSAKEGQLLGIELYDANNNILFEPVVKEYNSNQFASR
jgi:hypothetical protein